MKRVLVGMLLATVASLGFSTSFGVIGETFPVREMSFLDFIEQQLKTMTANGALDSLEHEWQARADQSANRPTSIGLPRTTVKRTYHYDPTVILTSAILNSKGGVLYPIGTRVNGLEQLTNYVPCWLFFNVDDKAQLRWAAKQSRHCERPKLILTGGAVRDAETALNAVIYFDQGGSLSRRFQLKAVPAIVTRDGNRLQISEIVIKGNGDAI